MVLICRIQSHPSLHFSLMENHKARPLFVFFLTFSALIFSASLNARESKFQGSTAFSYTRQATAFGERPSGSNALEKARAWILKELKTSSGEITLDSFTGQTPTGPTPMVNIIVRFPGKSAKSIVVSGHYDTKRIPMVRFVGANDAGSSTGFLLELARLIPALPHADDIVLVFFDGEEALGEWSDTNSRYGSRHLAAKWLADGSLGKIKALINVDMVGDKSLDLSNDSNSSDELRAKVSAIAARLKYSKFIRPEESAIDDDHKPFADVGVKVIDIIDLDYGPQGRYWHTDQDTMDKISAASLQVVGDLVVALVEELDAQR